MFERVLVAVDGSDQSGRAASVAGELAGCTGGELVVFHAREHETTWGIDVDVETSDEATSLVERIVRELKEAGLNVRGEIARVRSGQAAQAILDAAHAEGADLIVTGTRGLSEWSRLWMGSVAEKVVRLADVPVLVAR